MQAKYGGKITRTHPVCLVSSACTLIAMLAAPAHTHPHVFVDGGVDFVFDDKNRLSALNVTWLYDAFETLYILSSYGMSLNANGTLDEADRQELIRQRSNWPSDFDGASHLSIDTARVSLGRPVGLDAQLIDGRLKVSFTRNLETAVDLSNASAEVAFYEATYYYAFKVTNEPKISQITDSCRAIVIPFDPNAQHDALQLVLAKLGREETPENDQIGALFADRIAVQCG